MVALAFGACRSAAADERAALTAALGRDPVAVLRAIGEASDAATAKARADALADQDWTGAERLRLLRFGLAHHDERVVFGAVMAMGDHLAVPELRHAAAVVLPRLGDPDCPVSWSEALPMIGSVDVGTVVAVIPRLPEEQASALLDHMHRMVRADAIPALCALARTSEGAVRRAAFADATLAAEYSQQHVPLLVATWLDLVGRAPDPDPDAPGLPGLLSAALRAHLEVPVAPPPAEGELDRRVQRPTVPLARWLVASTPGPADVPLLRALLESEPGPAREAAIWSLGGIHDVAAREVLGSSAGAADATQGAAELVRTAARARSGDAEALSALLGAHDEGLVFGIALAAPERRREWFAGALALPFAELERILLVLETWADNELFCSFVEPPYDDRYFGELESLLAASPDLDVRVLRAFVQRVPACATARLADALLLRPADRLFAAREWDGEPFSYGGDGSIGHKGVWPFLEVTRPDAFRRRLREGLDSEVAPVRDLCASLLIRLGDTERLDDLVAWIDASDDLEGDEWWNLAQDGDARVVAELERRLAADDDRNEVVPWMRALAATLGMPRELAQTWGPAYEQLASARVGLLEGDVVGAFLRSPPEFRDGSAWAARWHVPEVQAWARRLRDTALASGDDVYWFDQLWALASSDRASLEEMLGPVRDGRYATHHGFSWIVAARAEGLGMLSFWIDDLASNCCRVAVVEDVLRELFQENSWVYERSQWLEPGSVFLRRTLLPVADRLRWSRIANAYVVAGR